MPPPPRAPWRPLLQSHISKIPGPEFSFGTVFQDKTGNPYPRVRTCIFRGFFAEIELHHSAETQLKESVPPSSSGSGGGDSCLNPAIYASDMLTCTTDVRMEKCGQIQSSGDAGTGTGAGEACNQVECVFWAKDVMTQWRLKGKAFVIGGDSGQRAEERAREEVGRWLHRRGDDGQESSSSASSSWSWEKEVTTHFANMSPIMRGSFKNPPPGTPMSAPISDPNLKQGQKVNDLHDPVARGNFRVIAIQPEEVESIDLSVSGGGKRYNWKLVADQKNGALSWEKEELWP